MGPAVLISLQSDTAEGISVVHLRTLAAFGQDVMLASTDLVNWN